MKEYYINELKSNMEIIDFFMVKSIGIKVGSNNKQYLDLHLADNTGEVSAKKWDVSEGEQHCQGKGAGYRVERNEAAESSQNTQVHRG